MEINTGRSVLSGPLGFLRFAETTAVVRTNDQLIAALQVLIRDFGYDSFLMGDLSPTTIDQKEEKLQLLVSYPTAWMDHYLAQHHVEYDPVCLKGRNSRVPFTWAEAEAEFPAHRCRRVMDEARDFGLRAGVGIQLAQSQGRIIGFGFSSPHADCLGDPGSLALLRTAAFHLFSAYEDLNQGHPGVPVHLTPREREVLQWIALGKTKLEVAVLLGTTETTVKRHCENLAGKLGTNTLAFAVAKALRLALIS